MVKVLVVISFLGVLLGIYLVFFHEGTIQGAECGKGMLTCHGIPLQNKMCLGVQVWEGNVDCAPVR